MQKIYYLKQVITWWVTLSLTRPAPNSKLYLSFVQNINGRLREWFSPDSSGILTPTMAMRTMAGGGRSNVGTPPDKPVRTSSTSEIQADSRISSTKPSKSISLRPNINKNTPSYPHIPIQTPLITPPLN